MQNFDSLYYLGPNGSNSHNAVINFLNTCNINIKNITPEKSIKSAISSLEKNNNSIAILPIENSIEGLVRETIDNFLKIKDLSVRIQGELTIPINHLLLSTTKDSSKIKKIYSHPQALAQCSNYIFNNFPNAELKEVSSTSYAAEKISLENDSTQAAIANETCAGIFNLNIIDNNINDEKDNKTRFYILSRKILKNNSTNKTALMLSPKLNYAGSLCDILKIFSKYKINLSYIDSRPSKKHLGEYLFFMEFDGLENDIKIKIALDELKNYTDFFRLLGSFGIYT